MKEINREHFEAWLDQQPDDRQLYYMGQWKDSKIPCLFCAYARETLANFIIVGDIYIRFINDVVYLSGTLEVLARRLPFEPPIFTIKDVKQEYTKILSESSLDAPTTNNLCSKNTFVDVATATSSLT